MKLRNQISSSSRKDSTNPTSTAPKSRGGGNRDHVWMKLFSDHFHRTNSTNALFLRQYYSLLKMERQLHKLCHHYVQSLQQQRPSHSSNTSSVGDSSMLHPSMDTSSPSSSMDKEVNLSLKLLHDKTNKAGTTTPVRINELSAPSKLLFLPNLMMPTADNNTLKIYASNYYSKEPLYQEIINLTSKVGISWCNISTTMVTSSAAASHHPPHSSPLTQSTSTASSSTPIANPTTKDDYYNTDDTSYYIPCNVMRAQNWVYATYFVVASASRSYRKPDP